jgi:hypothetical protein
MSNVMQQSQILPTVRSMVREKLLENPTYLSLPLEERKAVAQDTVTALTYILGGETGKTKPNAVTLADRTRTQPSSNSYRRLAGAWRWTASSYWPPWS